jgi:ribosomal protein S18 acetylase RimI-like enzyme
MEIRSATTDDIEAVRRVARESLGASYSHALSESILDGAVERWYGAEDLVGQLDDESVLFLVAEDDGEVVGFAQSYVGRQRDLVGEIDWLHVAPGERGRGVGSRLLERVEELLVDRGVDRIDGRVLTDNETGTDFYGQHGYDAVGERRVTIGEETFAERAYSKFPGESEPVVVVERRRGPDGTQLFVAYDEAVRGSQASFYPAFLDEDCEEQWGWMCGRDESFDVAMDSMERMECNTCGNRSKPARWDAAYL